MSEASIPTLMKKSKGSKRSSRRIRNRTKNKACGRKMTVQRGPCSLPDTPFEQPWCHRPEFGRFWQHYNLLMGDTRSYSSMMQHAAHADTPTPTGNILTAARAKKLCSFHRRQYPFMNSRLTEVIHDSISSHVCQKNRTQRQRKRNKTAHNKNKAECPTNSDVELTAKLSTGMQIYDTDDNSENLDSWKGEDDQQLNHFGGSMKMRQTSSDHDDNIVEQTDPSSTLSTDFLAFVEQSLRHKEKMKIQKDLLEKKQSIFPSMDLGSSTEDIKDKVSDASVRSKEMEHLYGTASAAHLHAMETSVQLTFDRVATRHNVALWPNIPINIMFDDTGR